MSDPRQYSIALNWAGNLEDERELWTAEISAFGAAARVHGVTRAATLAAAEVAIDALILAYQGQGLSLPVAEGVE
jgi:predicted RNase H-like HicB family nuclease